ncbi:tryptophan synthase beta subunit-like PLP-dependent enzyme [Flammula alnicola]|nr:tryptophan synthase beta subunit-like PLP-dependent enzyme [Flammula alnicola]
MGCRMAPPHWLAPDCSEWWKKQENIKVSNLGQQGFILNRYTVYEVASDRKPHSVSRRYSEFVFLWDVLVRRYPFRLSPSLPPKRVGADEQFLEQGRRGLARALNFVVNHPISGNTAIGLAMACAIKGYSVIGNKIGSLGLSRQPHRIAGVASRLQRGIPYGIILDQYRNVNNPLAHELTTGPEIIEAVVSTPSTSSRPSSEKVDVMVAGAGTGGTITGISRAIKKTHNPDCTVIGVDPKGSILALPESLNTADNGAQYIVEGIGYDFVPDVLCRDDVDVWLKTSDEESSAAVQQMMRSEGLLVGGSSGSALSGALRWLKSDEGKAIANTSGKNVVVLLPDGIRNYMSKPWFLKIAMDQEASPLSGAIAQILQKKEPTKDEAENEPTSNPPESLASAASPTPASH